MRVQSTAYKGAPRSIASSFGGSLPSLVVIAIENHEREYQGIRATVG